MKHVVARTKTVSRHAFLPRTCGSQSGAQRILCAVALLAFSGLALAQGSPAPAAPHAPMKPESPARIKSEGSYSLGLSMGEGLRRASVDASAISTDRLLQGLRDGLAGKVPFGAANDMSIRTLVVSARARIGTRNHTAARSFLARNGKKKGVVTTASGLQYQVLQAGQGTSPKSGDTVVVNYRGTLLDGTEFDSSYKRGQPATFVVGRVIPGWNEALQLMKPGAKWRLYVPPNLAYDLNSPPPIPPGSMLIFDVNLLSVQPPQALPPQAPRPPAQPQP